MFLPPTGGDHLPRKLFPSLRVVVFSKNLKKGGVNTTTAVIPKVKNVLLNAIDLEKVKEGKRVCGQQTLKRFVKERKKEREGNLHAWTPNYNVSILRGSSR